MAEITTAQRLRGLVLSATELRSMTNWPDALVEDYLNLIDNFITLANEVDTKQDILVAVINVFFADSPFTVNDEDTEYVFDTTDGDISCQLLAGTDGRHYRMTDTGTTGNKVIVSPSGAELLYGSSGENIYNAETFDMTFESLKGWW